MKQLLRNSGIFNTKCLVRILALTSAGSALLYSNYDKNSKSNVSGSVSGPTSDSLQPIWPILRGHSIITLDHLRHGNLQLLSRIGSVPSEDSNQDGFGKIGDGSKSFAAAVAKIKPALVYTFFPSWKDGKFLGHVVGSGTIIDSDGTILTCAHVLSDSQGKMRRKVGITLQDGRDFVGTVVNADLHNDIAIVKIASRTPFPSAELGSSSKLRPGDWVVTMGAPRDIKNSITAGIVSCVDRKSSELGQEGMLREYIQTDCAANLGNSGGPLINLDGEVVGVHVMILATCMSFAVPIDSVLRIMEQFKKKGLIRQWKIKLGFQ